MHWLETYYGRRVGDPGDVLHVLNPLSFLDKKKDGGDINAGNNRYLVNSWGQISNLLDVAGIPSSVNPWAVAQVMFETNGLKSHISRADLNLSGITWINKPYQRATRGSKKPEGGYYAHFASYSDWARDFARILSIGGQNAPIHAGSLEDYVSRLAANHYFTSSPGPYLQGLKLILAAAGKLQVQQAKELDKARNPPKEDSWFKQHPLATGILLAVGGVFVIKVINN